jgi:hypothetical protein
VASHKKLFAPKCERIATRQKAESQFSFGFNWPIGRATSFTLLVTDTPVWVVSALAFGMIRRHSFS